MKTLSFSKLIALSIAGFAVMALVALAVPQSASATFSSGSANVGGGGGSRDGVAKREAADNRPFSIASIRSCVDAHIPSSTGSTTPETITKAKGESLIACIRNARDSATASAVAELLKKIEELKKQIQALKLGL